MDIAKWPWKKWFLSAATTTAAGGVMIACTRDTEVNACSNDGSDFTRAEASADVTTDGTIESRVDAGAPADATVMDATPTDADAAPTQDASDDAGD